MFKYVFKRIIKLFLHVLWIFPINKKQIYFESFVGKQISCNPLYIYRKLQKQHPEYTYVWCYNGTPPQDMADAGVTFVRFHSVQWIFAQITSRCIINNMGYPSLVPYRKRQFFINTWHGGGAYKRSGLKDKQVEMSVWNVKNMSVKPPADYTIISSNKKFTTVMSDTWNVSENIFAETGMPRNDMFFDAQWYEQVRTKTRKALGISAEVFLVLYAPTYRGIGNKSYIYDDMLNKNILCESVLRRFKKRVLMAYRLHYFFADTKKSLQNDGIDVSAYPDMQDLMCAADMLITDYSSSMWDFSFTGKPCILFALDIEQYDAERGFYTDPYSWGFPIAKTNQELQDIILTFDEDRFRKAMQQHHADLGSYEDGHATEKICQFIEEKLQK